MRAAETRIIARKVCQPSLQIAQRAYSRPPGAPLVPGAEVAPRGETSEATSCLGCHGCHGGLSGSVRRDGFRCSEPVAALEERAAACGQSGPLVLRDVAFGTNIAECPQAGMNTEPEPLNRIDEDLVWKLSEQGDDTRANTEYSCFPQNETTVDVNPTNSDNIVGGANDYRLGGSFSGLYATRDGGKHWYDTLHVVPSVQNGDMLDSSGDPAITFDREGTAYLASIAFNRTDDTNGIWVNRSTNGGFSWTRPCVAINVGTPTDDWPAAAGRGLPPAG